MSSRALALLAGAILIEHVAAAPGHFLGPDKGPALAKKAPEEQAFSAQQIATSVVGVLGTPLQRQGVGWLLKVKQPNGTVQVIDVPDGNYLSWQRTMTWSQWARESFFSWLVWVVVAVIMYLTTAYRSAMPLPERSPTAQATAADTEALEKLFVNGHFRCTEDTNICICSFFCPALRWSDTESLLRFLPFRGAFAAFAGVALLSTLVSGAVLGGVLSFLLLYYRQRLREKINLEAWTCGTCFLDFCYVCWCPCCAIAQEARIAKFGTENGLEGFGESE